jgi:hypothetical protein
LILFYIVNIVFYNVYPVVRYSYFMRVAGVDLTASLEKSNAHLHRLDHLWGLAGMDIIIKLQQANYVNFESFTFGFFLFEVKFISATQAIKKFLISL